MKVILILSLCQLAVARFGVSDHVLKVVHGNISDFRDLALPPEISRRSGDQPTIVYGDHEPLPDFLEYYDELHGIEEWDAQLTNKTDFDMKDLTEATKKVKDLKKSLDEVINEHHIETRRQSVTVSLPTEIPKLAGNPVMLRIWYYQKLSLTYLIHIRFKLDAALRYKMAQDKYRGYKIGYLYSRLNRLKFQMHRIMDELNLIEQQRVLQYRQNPRTKAYGLKHFFFLYEKLLDLEVDIKDTVDMMRLIFNGRPIFITEMSTTPPRPQYQK